MQTRIEPQLFRVLSFAAFVFPCPFLGATAGVAVHSTPLASTTQLVPEQESWEGEGLLESAAARKCCEAGARVTTNVFVRGLDVGVPNAQDGR